MKLHLSGSRAQAHRDVSDCVSFTLFSLQTVMSHSFYPPLMQRTSWTLAVPFKEQDCHRGPSDSIGNNYSLTARDMKLKDLLKVYQPVTINVPRDKTSQGLPLGTFDNMLYFVQNGALKWSFCSWVFILALPLVEPNSFIEPHSCHLWSGNYCNSYGLCIVCRHQYCLMYLNYRCLHHRLPQNVMT